MIEREIPTQDIDQIIGTMLIDNELGVTQSNIKPEYRVDIGLDSLVTKFDGLAFKFYGRGYDMGKKPLGKKVEFYRQVTNAAKRLAEVRDYSFRFSSSISYPLIINSFDELIFSEKHKVLVGVVPFVDGLSLGGANIAPDFSISKYLADLSVKIQDELGVAGINIATFNVKLNNNQFVVTDLCGHISRLHPFGKRKFK